jgi:SAM-dependent methyltransferase
LDHFLRKVSEYGPAVVLNDFILSPEFRRAPPITDPIVYKSGPPMQVQTRVAPEELDRLWDHVSGVWSQLGEEDPFWSVVTEERYRSAKSSEALRSEFYASGRWDIDRLEAWLARAGLSTSMFPVVAEYGCGLGRMTGWLASRFGQVRAFDISAPHLRAAEEHVRRGGLSNVETVQVRTRADLAKLEGADLFFSLIVLQHNPPPIIVDILDRAFSFLNPGGIAFFQIPTYSSEYSFDVGSFWEGVAVEKSMEMHFVPQKDIFDLARARGLYPVEVAPDTGVGNYDRWVSNTFLFRKDLAAHQV